MQPSPIRARTIDDFKQLITRLKNGKLISIQTTQNRQQIVIENRAALNGLFCYASDNHLYDLKELQAYTETASDLLLDKIELYNQNDHLISLKTLKNKPAQWQTLKPSESISHLLSDLNYTFFTSYEMPALKILDDVQLAYQYLGNLSLHKNALLPNEVPIDFRHPTYEFTRPSLLKADILRLVLLHELSLRKRLTNAKIALTDSRAVAALEQWIREINQNTKTTTNYIQYQFDKENKRLNSFIEQREAFELIISDKTLVTHKKNLATLKTKLETLNADEIAHNKSAHRRSYVLTFLIAATATALSITTIVLLGLFVPIAALLLGVAALTLTLFTARSMQKQLLKLSTFLEKKLIDAFNTIPATKKDLQNKIAKLDTTLILAEVLAPIKNDKIKEQCAELKPLETKSAAITSELSNYLKEIELQEYMNSSSKKEPTSAKKPSIFRFFSKPVVAKKIHAGAELGVKSIVALKHRNETA